MTKLSAYPWTAEERLRKVQESRIFIVDDSTSNIVLLTSILGQYGFDNITGFTHPKPVFEQVLEQQPDALIVDYHMPDIDGLTLVKQIRQQQVPDSFLPILMITADGQDRLKHDALIAGVNEFLTRPVAQDEVILRLTNLLYLRVLHQEAQLQNLSLQQRIAVYNRDLELREADARLQARRYAQLAALSEQLEIETEPLEVARKGLNAFMKLWSFDLGVMFQAEGDMLVPVVVVGEVPEVAENAITNIDLRVPGNLQQRVMTQREPVLIRNYSAWEEGLPSYRALGLTTLIGTPIYVARNFFGIMYVGKFETEVQMAEDAPTVLRAIQLRIERALERIGLLGDLRSTREEALRVVGLVLEYRDYETKGHTDRVATLATQLGIAAGLSDEELEYLLWGSYLHDTGKITIPDHILLKPGKLDVPEFELIKRHVVVGEEMLRHLEFVPQSVLEIIRYHHERWDGLGYPDGLAGEAIPRLARIFSVADVYDALVSSRPYKKPWTPEEAIAEILAQQGRQFDPELARLFAKLQTNDVHM